MGREAGAELEAGKRQDILKPVRVRREPSGARHISERMLGVRVQTAQHAKILKEKWGIV